VLGFFTVAGIDEERVFVDRPDELTEEFSYCFPEYFVPLSLIHPSNWPIYLWEDDMGYTAVANDECFDCRKLGGTTEKPAFWVD